MCDSPTLDACLIFAAASLGVIAAFFLARLDEHRETNRRRRIMAESLARLEQSQHRWVESPAVDLERRS